MKGMRNRIAHGYFEIDMGVAWETVQRALPELVGRIEASAE
ncbi:HepT-like ribonuclease domain-containing protein [Luteimonas sp. FCS-9]|nr:HepT-like ribonuclease domain-containing protein [Luteimonas sp. FCS-9]